MVRYTPEHKATTRRRLIETAGRRFKSDGLDGAGVATLVADAGLTNGAFYGHFASKEDLIASVIAQQLAEQAERLELLPPGPGSVRAYLQDYLSPPHRDDPAGGCPSAALLEEVGRCGEQVRQAYTDGMRRLIAAVARLLDITDDQEATDRAIALVTSLPASVQLARAVNDPVLSNRILATTVQHAMATAQGDSPTTDRVHT